MSDARPSRRAITLGAAILAAALSTGAASAQTLTKVTFGTDWLAQAEHGGFYQAVATGLYAKAGLDVTIRQGGPQMNVAQQIAAGVVDFQMGSESFFPLNFAEQSIPVVAVAALMQKSPRVLIAHPGQGNDTLAAMKGKPVLISASARNGYWLFLKAKYGFTDDQIRPYTFNMAPFLADPKAIQQGFVSSEPIKIEKEGGIKPVVILLADHGFDTYSNLVLTQSETVAKRPNIVKAFVEASIEGWYSYVYGDPAPGNKLILESNKDMSPEIIDSALKQIKAYGLVDSGDSLELGIGAMTEAKWKSFFDLMVQAGLYKADLNWKAAFSTAFVNQRHAIGLRK